MNDTGSDHERPSGDVESGRLELHPDGFGFIRLSAEALGYSPGSATDQEPYPVGHRDIYVPPSRIREHGLNDGDRIQCRIREPVAGERYRSAVEIIETGRSPNAIRGTGR
ncbi:MAG: hypothetical protein CMJ18_11935 [Phycisphaeraceae bacterium]|nr:hypothetical protein [Phycisphaeraceae bacterium]